MVLIDYLVNSLKQEMARQLEAQKLASVQQTRSNADNQEKKVHIQKRLLELDHLRKQYDNQRRQHQELRNWRASFQMEQPSADSTGKGDDKLLRADPKISPERFTRRHG